jgi:PAS domain-containing protein
MRSRLQRAFEMDTVDPETQYVNREPEPPLDVTLGVSLQSELISQLERREDKLSELKEAKARGEKVPEATMTRVQADVDALRRELDAFSSGGFGYATNASGRLVQKSVEEITRARESMRRTRDDETLNPYLDNVGAWAEVSEASAAVTKLDVAIERLAGAAEVSGKPFDADEMRELQEQRTVWGLRLVSAQIKGHRRSAERGRRQRGLGGRVRRREGSRRRDAAARETERGEVRAARPALRDGT